jgi:quinol monooxygenase YgiN
MSGFGLVVRFELKPGRAAEFDAMARSAVAGIAAHEPRTLTYAVHALADEPDVRIFYELYASEEALAEHELQATTRDFLDRVGDHVTSVDVQRLHLVTATGVPDPPPRPDTR